MRPLPLHFMILTFVVAIASRVCQADIIGFTDRDEWEAAVGDFTTITFTEFPQGTVITDQYADFGVHFADGNDFIYHSTSFLNDGAGLHGSKFDIQITVAFGSPQLWFGIDHPGLAVLDVYSKDNLIGTFENFGGVFGAFTGILVQSVFDRVIIHRGPSETAPRIDDMHWGVPAPGATAVLALAGLLAGSRRRRK